MPNMSLKKNEMPTQPAQVRAHNFNEVATGYTKEMAMDEAARCLNCKNMPCVAGCPVNINNVSYTHLDVYKRQFLDIVLSLKNSAFVSKQQLGLS